MPAGMTDGGGSVEVVVRSQQPWWLARNNPSRHVLTALELGIDRPKGERSMNIVLVVKNPFRLHMHCRDSNAGIGTLEALKPRLAEIGYHSCTS